MLDKADEDLQTLLELFKYLLVGANVVLFLMATVVFLTSSTLENATSLATPVHVKRALIVTAHPDDESMFFLPLLHSLGNRPSSSNERWQTHVLCLSRGSYDGLGRIREKELQACAAYLGLSLDHVQALDDPKLQDGMKNQWDVVHIAGIVAEYVQKNDIDAVSGVCLGSNTILKSLEVKRAGYCVLGACRSLLLMTMACLVIQTTLLHTTV